jgi:hypothetical protein
VTDNDAPHSGSRWEPHPWDAADHPFDPTAASGPPAEGPAAARRTGPARRGLLAGAGAGILVIGGVGGFAAGHALAGSGSGTPAAVQGGVPGQSGTGERPDFGDPDGRLGSSDGFGDGDHGGFDGIPHGDGSGSAPAAPSGGSGSGNATPGGNA